MTDLEKVYYVWDENLIQKCDSLPAVLGRASIVHKLIVAYGLHKHMTVVRSKPASYEEMREFHSDLYLDHLKTLEDVDDDYIPTQLDEEHGIGYDCSPIPKMYELVSTIAGASLTAARCLTMGLANVAINWCGGWHHANRFGAEGFCYINDIVIAIEHLKTKFSKVMYIDLDVHHGNGVEDAFNLSKSVLTLSYHKCEPCFYPGTGHLHDIGSHTAKGYAVNVPMQGAYGDEALCYAFQETFPIILSSFAPSAIVVQCGADSLSMDPCGGATVTVQGYCRVVQQIIKTKLPMLLLGGGGYKPTNASRLWSSLTALSVDVALEDDIPEHEYWTHYSPNYTLSEQSLARHHSHKLYLDNCIRVIKDNMKKYLGKKNDNASAN